MKKLTWHVTRTLLFWIIGLFNTIMIKPEDVGTWKNYLGYVILLIAVADTIYIAVKLIKNRNSQEY